MTFVDDDGNEIETSGDIAITKQSVSFFNSKIKGDVSTTFTIDNNSQNRKTLGYKGPQMLNQIAYTKQAFSRVRNGNILDRGFIVIQSDNGPTLSCFYVSGNSNWVQLLQGFITELDFSKYRVQINIDNIRAQNNYGIIFPFTDFCYNQKGGVNGTVRYISNIYDSTAAFDGSLASADSPFFNEQYPCVYLHTVMSELFSQNGLKADGNLFEDFIYQNIVITPANGKVKRDFVPLVTVNGNSFSSVPATQLKYNTFTGTKYDPENLFSNSSYNSTRFCSIIVRVNVVSNTNATNILLFKNGSIFIAMSSSPVTGDSISDEVQVADGDVLEIYTEGANRTITLNIRFEVKQQIGYLDYVTPNDFLTDMKCIDLVKFCINYFGCSIYFNDTSKTLSLNIIDKVKTEDSYDWSDYYVAHKSKYTIDQASNNYIKMLESNSEEVKRFNKNNKTEYGGGNIETSNTLKSENNLFTIPFSAQFFDKTKDNRAWLSIKPLINLEPAGDAIPFTVTNLGYLEITTQTLNLYEVIQVYNSNGVSFGYFVIFGYDPAPGFGYNVSLDTTANNITSGNVFRQTIKFNETSPSISINSVVRVSSYVNNLNLPYYANGSLISLGSENTTVNYAWFAKKKVGIIFGGYSIDYYNYSLAFDRITEEYNDPTIKELYFNKISRFLQNPDIEAIMILPEAAFQRFTFDRFIYLKTEQLTGYFFVESIENYVDGNTPVTVNLYMI